jgi:hypothetical protein
MGGECTECHNSTDLGSKCAECHNSAVLARDVSTSCHAVHLHQRVHANTAVPGDWERAGPASRKGEIFACAHASGRQAPLRMEDSGWQRGRTEYVMRCLGKPGKQRPPHMPESTSAVLLMQQSTSTRRASCRSLSSRMMAAKNVTCARGSSAHGRPASCRAIQRPAMQGQGSYVGPTCRIRLKRSPIAA